MKRLIFLLIFAVWQLTAGPVWSASPIQADVFQDFSGGNIDPHNPITAAQLNAGSHQVGVGSWNTLLSSGLGPFTSTFFQAADPVMSSIPNGVQVCTSSGCATSTVFNGSSQAYHEDLSSAMYLNNQCTGSQLGPVSATYPGGDPNWTLCTGLHTGTYVGLENYCIGVGTCLWGSGATCSCCGAQYGSGGGSTCGSSLVEGNCWGTCLKAFCTGQDAPLFGCTSSGHSTFGGDETAIFNFTTLPSKITRFGFARFHLNQNAENGTNLPFIGASTNYSWCNFNVYLSKNHRANGLYEVRTESSPGTASATYSCGSPSDSLPVPSGCIQIQDDYAYWYNWQYVFGPVGAATNTGMNAGCAPSGVAGTCTWGSGNGCACCDVAQQGYGHCGNPPDRPL